MIASHTPYRIGDINVSVRSDLPEVLTRFEELYRGFPRGDTSRHSTIQMRVVRTKSSFLRGDRYVVFGDNEEIGGERKREEVLPFLEWGINYRVIASRNEYLQIHAASLVRNGRGVIFAGTSGSGKSTLAAALLARGWQYLSDEFALIHRDTHQLHPYPKAVCLKSGSFHIADRLKLPFAGRRYYIKGIKGQVGYINPRDIGPNTVAKPAPIRLVVFPKFVKGQQPRIYRVARARAAFMLAGGGLNRNAFGDQGLSILTNVVRHAECFSLESGSIDDTCDLIESLVDGIV